MKWEDFYRYLNDGLEANNWRQFYFTLVELQVHWLASLGQSRRHYFLMTILGAPAAAVCFWIGYMTEYTSQDTSGMPLFSVIVWAAIAVPAKLMPVVYPIHLIVSLITGAFYKEFWECVEIIKMKNASEQSK